MSTVPTAAGPSPKTVGLVSTTIAPWGTSQVTRWPGASACGGQLPPATARVTPAPLRVGSRLAFVAQFLGRRLAYTYEVVELVPASRFVMRTAEGPFPMETTYAWEAVGEGATRMTLRNRGEPSGFSKLVAPFMAAMMERANRADLARLKATLERSSP